MGYDILAKVIEYTDSELDIDTKLGKVARLLVKDFPFDSIAIYLKDDSSGGFTLAASDGSPGDFPDNYGPGEGLPAVAAEKESPTEAYAPEINGLSFGRTRDAGLEGFQTAFLFPLKDGEKTVAVLYMKALRKLSIEASKKEILAVIALQVASTLKFELYSKNLKGAYSRLKEAQTQLIQAEKLLAIGELSATLAHEIKNPLVSIGGFARRLKKKAGGDSPFSGYADTIVKEVERLETIMDGILSYTENKTPVLSKEDANEVIKNAVSLFDESLKKHNIEVVFSLSASPLPVRVNGQEMNIAIDNIIANAIQSMDKGGTLAFSTSVEDREVALYIKDSGGGIDPGLVGNIFNPFFTTKESGTGLGLAITHKIISRHKGRIDVQNDVGKGVTFSIKLPLAS